MMPVGRRLWLWWVLAGTVGWAVGGPLGVAVGRSGDIIVAGSVGIALGGILTGVLQWLVLRRQVAWVGWWVLTIPVGAAVAGVVGATVGMVAGLVSNPGSPSPLGGADLGVDVGWVVGAGLFGPVLGVLQWLVLRRQVARAGWWVLVTTVGWVVGGPGAGIVSAAVDAAVGAGVSWAVLGAVSGAITGPVLVRLLRQSVPAVSAKA